MQQSRPACDVLTAVSDTREIPKFHPPPSILCFCNPAAQTPPSDVQRYMQVFNILVEQNCCLFKEKK